jgi:hypothetical protein
MRVISSTGRHLALTGRVLANRLREVGNMGRAASPWRFAETRGEAQMKMRTYPLRLEDGEAAELQRTAQIDGLTVAEEIRQAIRAHVASRRADPEFQVRLRESRARDEELYERLGSDLRTY